MEMVRQEPARNLGSDAPHHDEISDYLTFALTGERAGDASTVGFLGLYDLAKRRWWPEALDVFGIREEKLSSPLAPGSRCGNTRPKAFDLLGMHAGVPFAVGGLDHHIAALGSGLGQTVRVSISTGTVLAALTLVEQLEPQADCYHGLHTDGRAYFRLSPSIPGVRASWRSTSGALPPIKASSNCSRLPKQPMPMVRAQAIPSTPGTMAITAGLYSQSC